LQGLTIGIMPLSETLGTTLPKKSSLPVTLLVSLVLGVGVTFAEPEIGALLALGVQSHYAPISIETRSKIHTVYLCFLARLDEYRHFMTLTSTPRRCAPWAATSTCTARALRGV
jgi:hypothetical protein